MKIVRDNEKVWITACSSDKSISFVLEKDIGEVQLVSCYCASRKKIDNCGNSKTEFKNMVKRSRRKIKKILSSILVIMYFLIITAYFIIPTTRKAEIIFGIIILEYGIYKLRELIVLFIMDILGYKEFQEFRRMHGAEHAVINAYCDLHRVPTIWEIKRYSRLSYNCGSLGKIEKAVPALVIGIVRIIVPGWWFIPGMIIGLFLAKYLIKTGKICFLEVLVTNTPTKKEYKVAIKGLKRALEGLELAEKDIDEDWL